MPKKIIVIGDWILDRTIHARARKISVEADNTIVADVERTEEGLGGAANVAANLHSLGHKELAVLGSWAADEAGARLHSLAASSGLHVVSVVAGTATAVKTRIVSPSGRYFMRLDTPHSGIVPASAWADTGTFRRALREETRDGEPYVLCLAEYAKGCFAWSRDFVSLLCRFSPPPALIVMDPGEHLPWMLTVPSAQATQVPAYSVCPVICKCNVAQLAEHIEDVHCELRQLSDAPWSDVRQAVDRIEPDVRTYLENNRLHALVLTLGANGVALFTPQSTVSMSAVTKNAADVCGAGDVVLATLAYALAREDTLNDDALMRAVVLANKAAGATVARRGICVATPADLT